MTPVDAINSLQPSLQAPPPVSPVGLIGAGSFAFPLSPRNGLTRSTTSYSFSASPTNERSGSAATTVEAQSSFSASPMPLLECFSPTPFEQAYDEMQIAIRHAGEALFNLKSKLDCHSDEYNKIFQGRDKESIEGDAIRLSKLPYVEEFVTCLSEKCGTNESLYASIVALAQSVSPTDQTRSSYEAKNPLLAPIVKRLIGLLLQNEAGLQAALQELSQEIQEAKECCKLQERLRSATNAVLDANWQFSQCKNKLRPLLIRLAMLEEGGLEEPLLAVDVVAQCTAKKASAEAIEKRATAIFENLFSLQNAFDQSALQLHEMRKHFRISPTGIITRFDAAHITSEKVSVLEAFETTLAILVERIVQEKCNVSPLILGLVGALLDLDERISQPAPAMPTELEMQIALQDVHILVPGVPVAPKPRLQKTKAPPPSMIEQARRAAIAGGMRVFTFDIDSDSDDEDDYSASSSAAAAASAASD